MMLAFRTAGDFQTAASAAQASGFDGVELAASDAMLTDPQKIREIFAASNIEISSLACQLKPKSDELVQTINLAAAIGCKRLRVTTACLTGRTSYESCKEMLLPAADIAATAGIMILLENQPEPGSVNRLWHAVDSFNHPSIACCWNMPSGRVARELPLVTIPTLNSRIRMVVVCDDDPDLRKSIHRLRGIGFDGVVLVDVAKYALQITATTLRGVFV
jgi:hypothetical protein